MLGGVWNGGREGLDIKNNRGGRASGGAGRSQCGWSADGEWPPRAKGPGLTQVWARAVWHFRQSTWPSRGKQPLSSASMDSAFPQSWVGAERAGGKGPSASPTPPRWHSEDQVLPGSELVSSSSVPHTQLHPPNSPPLTFVPYTRSTGMGGGQSCAHPNKGHEACPTCLNSILTSLL